MPSRFTSPLPAHGGFSLDRRGFFGYNQAWKVIFMSETVSLRIVARLRGGFTEKFGVPRQAGLAEHVLSRVVFEPEFRNPDALRGIEGFSHLWLLWSFDRVRREDWSPTVRPPRLGGNRRMGVFATRSPFRPNPVGLSCVGLVRVEWDAPDGPALLVSGADMTDGTPIFDIKPYLPYADARPGASGGYTDELPEKRLKVALPPELAAPLPEETRLALLDILSHDPRPSYQDDPDREYGLAYGGFDVRFRVSDGTLHVFQILAL